MSNIYKLFKIQCYDLLCLVDMERAGIQFNTQEAMKYAKELEIQCNTLLSRFHSLVGSTDVSITSNDDLSVILYGGIITTDIRIPVGHYMSGAKVGQVRYKIEQVHQTFERFVEPLPKTETAKCLKNREKYESGQEETLKEYWEVNEPTLRSLKAKGKAKEIIDIILEYSKIDKLRGTYLEGYTKLIDEMDWEKDMLHTSFNQCVAVTGRLSSSKPNMQNADKITKKFMTSRYDNPSRY